MLSDERIEEISEPFIQRLGDAWNSEDGIHAYESTDFARAIEAAVLEEVVKNKRKYCPWCCHDNETPACIRHEDGETEGEG